MKKKLAKQIRVTSPSGSNTKNKLSQPKLMLDEMKSVEDKLFNTVYYLNDKIGNFQIFCLIDNNVVQMVSNIHIGVDEKVWSSRKKQ